MAMAIDFPRGRSPGPRFFGRFQWVERPQRGSYARANRENEAIWPVFDPNIDFFEGRNRRAWGNAWPK
jgi:hypothetical protein